MNELEDIYGNGCADQVSGDVEAPTGHFYRVGSVIVTTNSQGFVSAERFQNETEAIASFEALEKDFDEWADSDEL